MVRAIHIGRAVSAKADFDSLVGILESLGLQQEAWAKSGSPSSVNFLVPEGKLCISFKGAADLRVQAEGTDLLLEVSNPDAVFNQLEQRGLKFIADHHDGSLRLFVVELPGGIKTAVFGDSSAEMAGRAGSLNAQGLRFAIVVARFNSFITDRLLAGALDGLHRSGAQRGDVEIIRVPGSFEIPAAARALAESGAYQAIICLGCLIRGETLHYEVIANEVTRGIGQSAQETGVPHSLGVLTCDTLEQAIDRAGLKSGNKGFDAALAAIEMANLTRSLKSDAIPPATSNVAERASGKAARP
jgi:6,7-dimethyl-8-ribityllumazine synthase